MITKEHVGFRYEIHNGRTFDPLEVTNEMVGRKFGEFSFTRKRPSPVGWLATGFAKPKKG
eukprot:CAMPEP_0175091316 /NCGR_PEP_ID=MMETSP0086_2-20121207/1832_1 /TAXON_ID=136419 /ORGANISM="Unknown Unknown, Strain D1" /LENGTH=59 /DNA_ID=CAMNT_0016364039 /DNA_START=168 /DNA_END=347 /DNA_ORIENTATION=+